MAEGATPTLSTRFTVTYGVAHPIAAAGMAFVTLSAALPAAVNRAGALGCFAAGVLPIPLVREALREIRAQSGGPVHLNLITPFATDEHIDAAVAEAADVVSFHWAHPGPAWRRRLREAGIRWWHQVGSVDEARRALDDGAELLVAQGLEAGGHCRSRLPTFVLTPAIVDEARDVPVLAAGGIADGRGLAAALALGADGAWVGTRFVASAESDAAPEYKAALLRAGADDAVRTARYGRDLPDFNPMRVLRNALVDRDDSGDPVAVDAEQPVIGHTVIAGRPVPVTRYSALVPVAGASGDIGQMALPAGLGVAFVRDIAAVRDIIEGMVSEAAAILTRLAPAPGGKST